jgi:hypothetical protein
MNIVELLAPYFERYITINGTVRGKSYNYVKRGFKNLPVVDITFHSPKCDRDSWLYVAVAKDSKLAALRPEEKLYAGSQTSDRMFRGDGLQGKNFHHAEMRSGNGERNLIRYLNAVGKVEIHRISARGLAETVAHVQKLRVFAPLLLQPNKHPGYWFEQAILFHEPREWAWNTNGTENKAGLVIGGLSILEP